MKKALAWLALPLAVALVATGAWLAVGPLKLQLPALLGASSESRNTQVIDAVTREQQVVLLSLAIQGIEERKANSTFMGMNVPGSERVAFMQYGFNAKVGLEGRDVGIRRIGEHAYLISIPRFIFIGHDNETFRTVVEDNGVLSFATPEIDTAAMITGILNDDEQEQYIVKNKEILQDQAKLFYSSLISGIDPGSSVIVEFTD